MSNGDITAVNATVTECYTSDLAYHGMGEEPSGHDGLKGLAGAYLAAFPDITLAVESQVESGDLVATRFIATGHSTGEFDGKPPIGKAVRFQVISITRFVEGKIAEEWEEADLLGMMGQLGHMPG